MADETKATYTTHLQLEKPGRKQKYDINVHNTNYDKIDEKMNENSAALDNHKQAGILDHPNGSVTEPKLATDSVTTSKIKNANVTLSKLASDVLNYFYSKSQVDGLFSSLKVIPKLRSETLSALGVKYSFGQNGYVCFGELFGGFILQWGENYNWEGKLCIVDLPIALTQRPFLACPYDMLVDLTSTYRDSIDIVWIKSPSTRTQLRFVSNSDYVGSFGWFCIGI